MAFYDTFADRYDDLAWSEERRASDRSFLADAFDRHGTGIERVHDCACGTGHHVIALREDLDLVASGSDASTAMVERARELATERGTDARFDVVDFRELTATYDEASFDALVCIGNSLGHLADAAELRTALSEMHAVLADGGLLVVGQRNFDRLLAECPDYLPVRVTDDSAFVYALDYQEDAIEFDVLDLDLETCELAVETTTYTPFERATLQRELEAVGFTPLAWYGNAALRPLDLETDDTYRVVSEA